MALKKHEKHLNIQNVKNLIKILKYDRKKKFTQNGFLLLKFIVMANIL